MCCFVYIATSNDSCVRDVYYVSVINMYECMLCLHESMLYAFVSHLAAI